MAYQVTVAQTNGTNGNKLPQAISSESKNATTITYYGCFEAEFKIRFIHQKHTFGYLKKSNSTKFSEFH